MGLIPSRVRASSWLTCVQEARWGAPGRLWTHVEVSLLARASGGAEGLGACHSGRWLPQGGSLFSQDSKEAEGRSLQDPQGA